MRPAWSPIVVLALGFASLAWQCGAPPVEVEVTREAEIQVPPEATTSVPPEDPTEVPPPEPADLTPSPAAGEEEPPITYEPSLLEDFVERLRAGSVDGVSDPVLVFADDFRLGPISGRGWRLYDAEVATVRHVAQMLEISVNTSRHTAFAGNEWLLDGSFSDFYFQSDFRADGPEDNGFGIEFRRQAAGSYRFTVSGNGSFRFDKFEFVEEGVNRLELFPWTSSPSIARGELELNVLGVLALGPMICLYINGEEVLTHMDPDLPDGGIAFIAQSNEIGGVRIGIDNTALWVPAF